MKRIDVLGLVVLLVEDDANHFEPRPADDLQQPGGETIPLLLVAQDAERSLAIDDVRTMQHHRIVWPLTEHTFLEPLQIICKGVVIVALQEPDAEQREIPVLQLGAA